MWDNARGFAEIRKLWLARAAGLGQQVAVRAGGSIVEGTFDTLDAQGCMIVRTATAGLVPITAGDVYFGSAASVRAV
jgi:BirA family biotin operon repressor/biotin-[acetyl-CoA-carboxylase] ligase